MSRRKTSGTPAAAWFGAQSFHSFVSGCVSDSVNAAPQQCPHCFTEYRHEKPMCSCEAKNEAFDRARELHEYLESNRREDDR